MTPFLLLLLLLFLALTQAKTVRETLNLTWSTGSPNGVPREMIFTNGQYPGPVLVWDEGDEIEVTVHNHLPFNTTVHWHGLRQHNSPWSDGVAGLSQRPIQPDASFVYRFTAEPAGTYWYHSHVRSLLQDGQIGGIYIRQKELPFHLISNDSNDIQQMQAAAAAPNLLMLADWTSLTSAQYYQAQVASGYDLFCVDSLLINGHGSTYCPGADFLQSMTTGKLSNVENGTLLTDKGCLQVLLSDVQSPVYLNTGNIDAVPSQLEWNCTPSDGGMYTVQVDAADGWASLNFVASQALKGLIVSVDSHPMWIYEADGGLVEPQQVEAIEMFNGVRYAVLIRLDQPEGNYSIRVADNGGDQVIGGYATLSYKPSSSSSYVKQQAGPHSKGYIDYGGTITSTNVRTLLLTQCPPPYNVPPPSSTAAHMHFSQLSRLGTAYNWTLGGRELFIPEEWGAHPILQHPDPAFFVDENAALLSVNDTWVDIIVQVVGETDAEIQPPHPIHKHGNKGYLVGQAAGFFGWTSVDEAVAEQPESFNLVNPPYRDTFTTAFLDPAVGGAWFLVIRYHVETPGAFLLHCHIATHQQSGMAMALLEGVDVWPTVPEEYQ
ncbi:hypothetical protein ASPZODRAFT_135325 [Penicilliopsis zonata CBS 506.65]|uniref:Uncharacterized protein n=1 Tax=Penicilliopsis zonata CBS 506.65 TaxID=1073090 RepID=A0A1L9S9T6_9EURO|nr:hypothetical protein ASPZODRAFT_135325 [Penicilliopsis zonata CBS 506.65]OJJ43924.1 hypothetical protein ASPZODRAFT_135325 [Penicilliopsis zonata CBS 506.65]